MKESYNKAKEYNVVTHFQSPMIFECKIYSTYMFSRRKDFGDNLQFWFNYD